MRKLRDVLRLRLSAKLSLRQIGDSLRLSLGAVQKITHKAEKLGLDWSAIDQLDDRNASASTAILSQLPTDQWYQSIGDNTLADAILDRLMHNAHRIKLKGESLRKKQAIS